MSRAYRSYHERRAYRLYRNSVQKRLIDAITGLLAMLVIATFFSFIVINWLAGCGEVFPTADGSYVHGECITPMQLFDGGDADSSS